MKRVVVAITAIATLLALFGCGPKTKYVAPAGSTSTPTAPASAGGSPVLPGSPSSSASPGSGIEFTVDGAGPYLLGAKLADLQTTPGFAAAPAPVAGCSQVTAAEGSGVWKGVHFSFRNGLLYLAVNLSTGIPTPSGAWLGTPLAQLKSIYASTPNEQLTVGTRSGFLVTTVDGHGILFDLNAQSQVQSMTAGDAAYLKGSYQRGTTYC